MIAEFFNFRHLSSYQRTMRLFLIPFFIGTLILVIIPALATVGLAFTEYKAIGIPEFNGFNNFRKLVASSYVRLSVYNTLFFLVLAVPARVLGALFLAMLLQRKGRLFGFFRAAVYLPTIIPEVAYALIWLWILNPLYGPINLVLMALGLPAPPWLADANLARVSIVMVLSFQIGEGFVILFAGLQQIPRSLYEAARVDGANSWQAFWRITLPLILPWLLLLTFRDILVSLQNTFTPSFVMTYGGPYYATIFAPLLIYELSFDFFDFGMASAFLLLMYLAFLIIVLGIFNLVGQEPDSE
ncbi:MAG: sugar ABC transporter permease [Anaerolineales bacterium]